MQDKNNNHVIIITTSSNNNQPQKHAKKHAKKHAVPVAFQRSELDAILRIYGQMVAAGKWRDYAIDHMVDCAVFSIFRKANETPLYRVEKNPKLANRQGAYSVIGTNGIVLKRGQDLKQVLRLFDKLLLKIL